MGETIAGRKFWDFRKFWTDYLKFDPRKRFETGLLECLKIIKFYHLK